MTNNHFEPGAYTNRSSQVFPSFEWVTPNGTMGEEYEDAQLFKSMLEGRDTGTGRYEDLTPSQCAKRYSKDFLSTNRNLFLITSHTSNATHNDTLLDSISFFPDDVSPSRWVCRYNPAGVGKSGNHCNPYELASNVTRGLPWQMDRRAVGLIEISGCKSERTVENCKVQFSLGIMIVVVCCNLIKAASMIIAVVRSREPTLVTLGDAIDSFLRIPDETTVGVCYADRQFIEKEWGWRMKTGPREWDQKEVQRWTSVSKTRWITCNFFCSVTIIAAGVLLRLGIQHDGWVFKADIKSM